jgi:hypothetical protein
MISHGANVYTLIYTYVAINKPRMTYNYSGP